MKIARFAIIGSLATSTMASSNSNIIDQVFGHLEHACAVDGGTVGQYFKDSLKYLSEELDNRGQIKAECFDEKMVLSKDLIEYYSTDFFAKHPANFSGYPANSVFQQCQLIVLYNKDEIVWSSTIGYLMDSNKKAVPNTFSCVSVP